MQKTEFDAQLVTGRFINEIPQSKELVVQTTKLAIQYYIRSEDLVI